MHWPISDPYVFLALQGSTDRGDSYYGFKIGYSYGNSVLTSAKQNLQGAITHPDVVEDYLHTEIKSGRLAGLFPPHAVPNVHISRFGVIPKSHHVGK